MSMTRLRSQHEGQSDGRPKYFARDSVDSGLNHVSEQNQ